MKLLIQWEEGNEIRSLERELPTDITWEEMQLWFRQAVKKAYKFSLKKAPKGLLNEGEIL